MCYILFLNEHLHLHGIKLNSLFYSSILLHKVHFLWFCQLTFSKVVAFLCFFFSCWYIDLCILWLICHVTLWNQNHFCKTMVFVYLLFAVFAIIQWTFNQDTSLLAHVFNEIPRNKGNLTLIKIVHHPINYQYGVLLSCILNLHLQKIVWIIQGKK